MINSGGHKFSYCNANYFFHYQFALTIDVGCCISFNINPDARRNAHTHPHLEVIRCHKAHNSDSFSSTCFQLPHSHTHIRYVNVSVLTARPERKRERARVCVCVCVVEKESHWCSKTLKVYKFFWNACALTHTLNIVKYASCKKIIIP